MPNIGVPELLIILVVFLLLFGGRKLGEVGKGLGEGIKNFKAGLRDASDETKKQA